jgi:hypothetical protein
MRPDWKLRWIHLSESVATASYQPVSKAAAKDTARIR